MKIKKWFIVKFERKKYSYKWSPKETLYILYEFSFKFFLYEYFKRWEYYPNKYKL